MSVLFQALFLLAAAVAQVSVLPYLAGGVNVDLVLLTVVAWGMIRGVRAGLLWGLIGGLILDVLSAMPFGVTLVMLGALGLVSGLRPISLMRHSLLSTLVLAAVVTVVYDSVLMAVLALFGWGWHWLEVFQSVVLPAALLNAGGMLLVYWLLSRFNRETELERAGRKILNYV